MNGEGDSCKSYYSFHSSTSGYFVEAQGFFCSYNICPNIVASCSIHLFTHDMRLILLFSDVMRHFSGVIEPGNNYLLISLAITSEVNWFYTCFGSTFKSKIMHRSKCS